MVIRKQIKPKLEAMNVKENGLKWGRSLKFL